MAKTLSIIGVAGKLPVNESRYHCSMTGIKAKERVLSTACFHPTAQELNMLIIRLYGCPVFIGSEQKKPPTESSGVKHEPPKLKQSITG
ncbi:hypothetical protein AB8989_00875 [Yersinia hibernica]|uniref:hypothetical protein n=1 Tax=Yersinia hibernica TaxID=2339259 RepID=UPI00100E733F|nr:hypothetical protein [Yersinia hibernica]